MKRVALLLLLGTAAFAGVVAATAPPSGAPKKGLALKLPAIPCRCPARGR